MTQRMWALVADVYGVTRLDTGRLTSRREATPHA